MQACGHTPIWSGERVLKTNARGRHTYLPEFKHWIVAQALQPGMSLAGLAMSNQVNANQLRRWVQLHGKPRAVSAAAATLLPVMIAAATEAATATPLAAPAKPSSGPSIEIELGGALLRVHAGVDAATLRTVLHCLRGTPP